MTQQEYEQKRRECFVKFCKDNGIDQEVNISIFDAFDQIFDRAYALGKQENDMEDTVIQGWVCRDKKDNALYLHAEKPYRAQSGYDECDDPEPKCLHFKDGKCAHPAVAHLENGKLVKGADCDVSSCEDVEYEPKPDEPKFKEGDRAIYCIPEKQRIKARVVNVRQRSGSTLFNTLFNYDILLDDGRTANWVDEQWLLPDNDDQVRAVTEKASEQFDRIIKDDFKKQNRLNIAAMAMAGMLASPVDYHDDNMVKFALEYADALIAAAEKGGCQ